MTASSVETELQEIGDRLSRLSAELGGDYWTSAEVRDLQAALRLGLGRLATFAEDQPPAHQRSRLAARYESRYAHLLWPR
jgi:hypothetical protein